MKNLFYIIVVSIMFSSCKVANVNTDFITGTYTATGKDYNYKLVLNKDNTFNLKFKALEANSGCEGIWKLNGTETLVLTCNEPQNITETLQGGYMSNRIQELTVVNRKKLKYNRIILKKE